VFGSVLPQNEVFRSVLQNGVFKFVLPQNGVFNNVIAGNCPLSIRVKITVDSLLNIGDKILKFLTSNVMHNAEKLAWTIRILLECLQHVLQMYAWSLSENQASIQFKCIFIGLMLRQSLFRKHNFAALVH
jgi:hypothetical protein